MEGPKSIHMRRMSGLGMDLSMGVVKSEVCEDGMWVFFFPSRAEQRPRSPLRCSIGTLALGRRNRVKT